MKRKVFVKKQIYSKELFEQLQYVKDFKGVVPIRNIKKQGKKLLIYMDYIEGISLEKCSEEAVVHIGIQLCEILHQFHTHNPRMIYRDLKPANLLINDKGQVFLIDFDTVWMQGRNSLVDKKAVGTEGYAPFEQYIEGMAFQATTDIYALGVTLMEFLTNERPWEQESMEQWIERWYGMVSEPMLKIVQTCTAWHMQNRYQTCIEVKEALKRLSVWDGQVIS